MVNKLLLGLIAGAIISIIGVSLLSLNSYFFELSNGYYNSYSNTCSELYPPTLVHNITYNVTNYNYSTAYYSCEQNQTMNYQIYSSLTENFGLLLSSIGSITIVTSIVLLLIAAYKDRNIQRPTRK